MNKTAFAADLAECWRGGLSLEGLRLACERQVVGGTQRGRVILAPHALARDGQSSAKVMMDSKMRAAEINSQKFFNLDHSKKGRQH